MAERAAPKAPWSVPASAADEAPLRALEALALKPESVVEAQRAESARWILDAHGSAYYDGAASVDAALVARLVGLPNRRDYFFTKVKEDFFARETSSLVLDPVAELRLTGLAARPDGRREEALASFETLDGRQQMVSARLVWLVGRLFGGWGAATQHREDGQVTFWRGNRPIAAVMPLVSERLEPATFRWIVGAPPTPPTFTPFYDGPLPPAPERYPGGNADPGERLHAYLAELVPAAGGFHDGYGWIVPTRAGIARFTVRPSAVRKSDDWWLYWQFDETGLAGKQLGALVRFDLGYSGKWNVPGYAHDLAGYVLERLQRLQLPPALRPGPALLRLIERTYSRFARYRPAWRDGRWRVARTGGGFELLRGGYAAREPAAWRAMQLDVSSEMRDEVRHG